MLSRTCALPPQRERERSVRASASSSTAVAFEKTSGERERDGPALTSTAQHDHTPERKPHALSGRVIAGDEAEDIHGRKQ